MRVLGVLGGMSWESTAVYYRLLNEGVRAQMGGLHAAPLRLHSFDFAEIAALQAAGDWPRMAQMLGTAAQGLRASGAEAVLLATNTMHKLAAEIEEAAQLPLLHIADATAQRMTAAGVTRPLLLATRYTMEEDFYTGRLRAHGLAPLIPEAAGRTLVHDVIYDELCRGVIRPQSRSEYLRLIDDAARQGADGVIFGCTEIGLLLRAEDVPLPAFDTTVLHCEAAVQFMTGRGT